MTGAEPSKPSPPEHVARRLQSLHATSHLSLGLLLGVVGLPVAALVGYSVQRGFAADGSAFAADWRVLLAIPLALLLGAVLGLLMPTRKVALGILGGLAGITGLPILVLTAVSLGSALGTAPHDAMRDRFALDGSFLAVSSGLVVLHLLCTATAAMGVLAGCRMRTRTKSRTA